MKPYKTYKPEVIHYNGYIGIKVYQEDKPIWEVLKDSEFMELGKVITYMPYYDDSMENLKNFNTLIDKLTNQS